MPLDPPNDGSKSATDLLDQITYIKLKAREVALSSALVTKSNVSGEAALVAAKEYYEFLVADISASK